MIFVLSVNRTAVNNSGFRFVFFFALFLRWFVAVFLFSRMMKPTKFIFTVPKEAFARRRYKK